MPIILHISFFWFLVLASFSGLYISNPNSLQNLFIVFFLALLSIQFTLTKKQNRKTAIIIFLIAIISSLFKAVFNNDIFLYITIPATSYVISLFSTSSSKKINNLHAKIIFYSAISFILFSFIPFNKTKVSFFIIFLINTIYLTFYLNNSDNFEHRHTYKGKLKLPFFWIIFSIPFLIAFYEFKTPYITTTAIFNVNLPVSFFFISGTLSYIIYSIFENKLKAKPNHLIFGIIPLLFILSSNFFNIFANINIPITSSLNKLGFSYALLFKLSELALTIAVFSVLFFLSLLYFNKNKNIVFNNRFFTPLSVAVFINYILISYKAPVFVFFLAAVLSQFFAFVLLIKKSFFEFFITGIIFILIFASTLKIKQFNIHNSSAVLEKKTISYFTYSIEKKNGLNIIARNENYITFENNYYFYLENLFGYILFNSINKNNKKGLFIYPQTPSDFINKIGLRFPQNSDTIIIPQNFKCIPKANKYSYIEINFLFPLSGNEKYILAEDFLLRLKKHLSDKGIIHIKLLKEDSSIKNFKNLFEKIKILSFGKTYNHIILYNTQYPNLKNRIEINYDYLTEKTGIINIKDLLKELRNK